MLQKLARRGKGFTLIELMICIAIIAILAAILIPNIILIGSSGDNDDSVKIMSQDEEEALDNKSETPQTQENTKSTEKDLNKL